MACFKSGVGALPTCCKFTLVILAVCVLVSGIVMYAVDANLANVSEAEAGSAVTGFFENWGGEGGFQAHGGSGWVNGVGWAFVSAVTSLILFAIAMTYVCVWDSKREDALDNFKEEDFEELIKDIPDGFRGIRDLVDKAERENCKLNQSEADLYNAFKKNMNKTHKGLDLFRKQKAGTYVKPLEDSEEGYIKASSQFEAEEWNDNIVKNSGALARPALVNYFQKRKDDLEKKGGVSPLISQSGSTPTGLLVVDRRLAEEVTGPMSITDTPSLYVAVPLLTFGLVTAWFIRRSLQRREPKMLIPRYHIAIDEPEQVAPARRMSDQILGFTAP